MGWSSAGGIFDPVAKALIELNASDEMKTRVLGDLIRALQDGDWDTGDESLDEFKDDPAIVAAFRAHGILVRCMAEDGPPEASYCEAEIRHDGDHQDYDGHTWPQATVA